VESVDERKGAWRDAEFGRRMSDAFHDPDRTYQERADLKWQIQRAALDTRADPFEGMTMAELLAEVEEIDARVRSRRPVS
jgi:hypothetical protein